jgi:uncharacterized integral membrane protein
MSVMKKLLWVIIGLPVAVIVVTLAVANRHIVTFNFDPISTEPALMVDAPLFVLLFLCLLAGIALGGTATWLRQARWRRTARNLSHEANLLRMEADRNSHRKIR